MIHGEYDEEKWKDDGGFFGPPPKTKKKVKTKPDKQMSPSGGGISVETAILNRWS
jgi:hypothetical protein